MLFAMLRTLLQSIGIAGIIGFLMLAFNPSINLASFISQEIHYAASAQPIRSPINAAQPKPEIPKEALPEGSSPVSTPTITSSALTPEPTPLSLEKILSSRAHETLVNILCTKNDGKMPISGSGVLIDPRGVILTNAHVAQFLLLDSDPSIDLSCVIRTGSPAKAQWKASIVYLPTEWVELHAEDIAKTRPLGTGEYDFALILVTDSIDTTPLPIKFPFVEFDVREKVHKTGNEVLLTAYPAEFAGNDATTASLLAFSSLTTIQNVLTFDSDTVDVFSFGAAAIAQSGSSGGSTISTDGKLIGIISTTSDGATLAQRDLRAITLAYINRALIKSTGTNLDTFLNQDVRNTSTHFMSEKAPSLAQMIIRNLPR